MSLLCWFPLCDNGDLSNKGLYNISLTSYGSPVYSTGGKVGGGCYKFNETTSPRQYLYSSAPLHEKLNNHSFSICGWIKSISNGDTFGRGDIVHVTYGIGFSTSYLYLYNTTKTTSVYSNTSVNDGNWHHMCGTYDEPTGNMCYYVDGILKGTNTYDGSYASSWTNGFTIAWDPNNSTDECFTKGYIQDVRVYDHCLSKMEVKEISKALVLHYPFCDPYIEKTTNIAQQGNCSGWNNSGTATRNSNETSIPNTPYPGKKCCSITQDTDGQSAITFGSSTTTITSKTITASVWFYVSGDITSIISPYVRSNYSDGSLGSFKYNGTTNISLWPKNTWIRLTTTFTASSSETNCYFCAYSAKAGCVMAFNAWQLEEKDHATPFVNGSRNENVMKDCSGFDNDGVITGNLSVYENSGRHNSSISFNGSSYISVPVFPSNMLQSCSFCLFVPSTIPSTGIAFLDRSSLLAFGYWSSGSTMIVACTNACKCVYDTASLTKNKWNHICILRPTGSSEPTLYVNGILRMNNGSTDCWGGSGSEFTIGTRTTATAYYFTGDLSDFRMYSTVLSESDILDLYHTSAAVDNYANLHDFQSIETESNLLRYENTIKYTRDTGSDTRGRMTIRNGVYAMRFRATDTYWASGDERNSKLLYTFFKPNTQYVFDLWLDTDDMIYNNRNVAGGFYIIYTDGTNYSGFIKTGAQPDENPKGFQHEVYISTAGKSVSSLSIYYYIDVVFYVRADSYIVPLTETVIKETGIVNAGQFVENTDTAFIGESTFNVNQLLEI